MHVPNADSVERWTPDRALRKRAVNGWPHQVPVRSPLSAAALLTGVRAVAGNGRSLAAERQLVALLQERYAPTAVLLTDSGTTALSAALLSVLHERPGSVALPAFSCYDLATAADAAGASVVLYDTDPHSLAPDLASVRAALRLGVSAIVVVHLYGYPVDVVELSRLAAEAGAVVIEDAAQAAGGTLRNRPAGTQSSLAILSFGRGKGLTGGSGGALLAHDQIGERVLERARKLLRGPRRGWSDVLAITAQLLLERPHLYAFPAALPFLHLGETVYHAPRPLRGATPVSCAVVGATWALADREVETRRSNAERSLAALRRGPEGAFETIRTPADARPGYLRLPVVASAEARRAVAQNGARRLGVMPGYPSALCDLEGFAPRCANRDAGFPGSRLLAARLCTLPTHGRLGAGDLARLEQWITTVGSCQS